MSNLTRSTYSYSGASRTGWIIGLLLLILLLVLVLAWHAERSVRTNNETATQVLRDYGQLVAGEFSRRAMSSIGYNGYYTHLGELRSAMSDSDVLPPSISYDDGHFGPGGSLAEFAFLVKSDSGLLSIYGDRNYTPSDPEKVKALLREISNSEIPQTGFAIEHVTQNGDTQTFVVAALRESSDIFGFKVNQQKLSSWLVDVFEKKELLPKTLAKGVVTNPHVYLKFSDNDGHVLFKSKDAFEEALLVVTKIGDDYNGIFENHEVAVAIDPMIAGSLVIGGLPESRLPVLIVVLLLTVALLLAAIRQLRREHALMKTRADFVAEVSHELRTPLTQIKMFTETLLFERFREQSDRVRALEIINRESQRLIHLVENILRFANGGERQRKIQLQLMKLAPIVESVCDEFRVLAESSGTVIQTDLDRSISANIDKDAISQIILNLLDNAVKYGPEPQTISVTLINDGSRALITVSDQGLGVPGRDRERIWGDYYRLERERESAIAGTGIGLAVVRQLVSAHGGSTWVEDAVAGGATFGIELPDASSVARGAGEVVQPEQTDTKAESV